MILKNFDTVFELARSAASKKHVVVAGAESMNAVGGGFECAKHELATPIFVGQEKRFRQLVEEGSWSGLPYEFVACEEGEDAGEKAVSLVAGGHGDCLMKGSVETADFLRPLVSRKFGLRGDGTLSLVSLAEVPGYDRLLAFSDPAILPFPDMEQRIQMVNNAVSLLHKLGVECPNVALLSALEVVSKAIPDTSESMEMVERWKGGEMPGCNLAGPISYDLMMSKEAAEVKGYDCPWCGEFDAVICPNIVVANVLGKVLSVSAHSRQAGIVAGAKVPAVLTSRSMSADDRLAAMAFALAVSNG